MSASFQDARTQASFSLGNRAARVIWGFVYWTLFRPSPPPLHEWRAMLLRCFGARLGRATHIYPGARIWAPWNLDCGDAVGVASGATLYNQGMISLGARVVVSQGVYLCSGTHDYEAVGFPLYTRPIIVGAEAWLAAECFVHPGVSIGDGVVVGARSVVVKDVPAWTVVAGNPAKFLKNRNYRPAAVTPLPHE
jgi:putative colanic acid biosynthesis acetyltransferase WcaF